MAGGASSVRISLFGQDVSLSQTMAKAAGVIDKTAGQIEGTGGRIKKALSGAFSSLSSTGVLGEYSESVAKVGEAVEGLGEKHAALGTKVATAGGVITGAGVAMSALASKDQAAQQQLSAAIDATGGSFEDYREEVEKTVKSQEKYGHTADETQNALATLTAATNDPAKALENMGLVANLAAARHEDLNSAASQVAKVLTGHGAKTLAQYGVTMKSTGDQTKDAQEATDELAKKLAGQASAATDTFSGKLDAAKARVTDMASGLAQKLGPALTIAGPALTVVGGLMDVMATRARTAAVAEAELGTASEVAGEETTMAFGPIGIALAAIAIAAYELFKHWDAVWGFIKKAASDAVGIIKRVFDDVVDFLKKWGTTILAVVAPFIGLPLLIWQHFSQIKTFLGKAFSEALSTVEGWIGDVGHAIASIPGKLIALQEHFLEAGVNLMKSVFSGIANGAKDVAHFVGDIAKDIVNGIIDMLNAVLPHKLPTIDLGFGVKVGGETIIPNIPHLATGGLVRATPGGTIARLAEAGEDEWVVPTSKVAHFVQAMVSEPKTSAYTTRPVITPTADTGSSQPLVVQVVLDGQVVATSTHRVLLSRKNRGVTIGLS